MTTEQQTEVPEQSEPGAEEETPHNHVGWKPARSGFNRIACGQVAGIDLEPPARGDAPVVGIFGERGCGPAERSDRGEKSE